ncbi:MAG: hypothetical protein ISR44_00440 [Rhodospirillales bacterium]|nr:hypothetical protein [Rhodospirillales bacterium]
MDDFTLARAIHVIAVVAWIGGVYLVTTVILPSVSSLAAPEERIKAFEEIEGRFAWHARVATVAAGASGFYMLYVLGAWEWYLDIEYWWLHAMTLIWTLFTLVLFVLEPLFLHDWFRAQARQAPERTFRIVTRFHRILLTASLITVAGAVFGVHG